MFRSANGIHGERRYLVYAGWWRKWLDYVNFDFVPKERKTRRHRSQYSSAKTMKKQEIPLAMNEAKFRDELLQLKQQKLDKSLERSCVESDINSTLLLGNLSQIQQTECEYTKPGSIENQQLLVKGNSMCLKPNLMENHDYVGLPQDAWRYIVAWYTTDWTIVRHLRRDIVNNEIVLDLYPGEQACG